MSIDGGGGVERGQQPEFDPDLTINVGDLNEAVAQQEDLRRQIEWTYLGSVELRMVEAVNRANGSPCANHHEPEGEPDGS